MAEYNDAKRQKLLHLSSVMNRLPNMSKSALTAFLKLAHEEELPTGNRHDLQRAASMIGNEKTPYGDLIKTLTVDSDKGPLSFDIACPFAMLHTAATRRHMSSLMQEGIASAPPTPETPWELILYQDEVTVGNVLRHDNPRKVQAMYYSFIQFPAAAMHKDRSI